MSPGYSPQSKGKVEGAIVFIGAQLRTIRFDMQRRYGISVTPQHEIWPWLAGAAGWFIARDHTNANGRTSYQDVFDDVQVGNGTVRGDDYL